ncbi:hypothetical protein JHK85_023243 [Glycine max]|nr:hypothetical protein JHK85_023243 [Glycine max]
MAKVVEGHRRYGSAHLKHALVLEPTTNKRAASTTERLRKLSDRYIILARDRYVYNGYKMPDLKSKRFNVVADVNNVFEGEASTTAMTSAPSQESRPSKTVFSDRRRLVKGYKSETLHAREEIVSELLQHLRGNAARVLLEGVMKSTRQMFAEQEAVQRLPNLTTQLVILKLHMASSATDHQDRAKS